MIIKIRNFSFLFIFLSSSLLASNVDISNPINLIFVADRIESTVDVIDVKKEQSVFQIDLPYRADQIIATAKAPLLFFTNIENKTVLVYNLRTQHIDREIKLDIHPRHIVMDPSGKVLGITDNQLGGIAILSVYSHEIVYQNADFSPTSDVLFDANEINLYFTNNKNATLGLLDLNTFDIVEIELSEQSQEAHPMQLSSPSRSLDGRYIYIADRQSGDVFSMNSYSGVIYKTFNIGSSPARPYSTPEGTFLYLMDTITGRFIAVEQNRFTTYVDTTLGEGIDIVTSGRFDRISLFLSTQNEHFYRYDNIKKQIVSTGQMGGKPINAQGSVGGEKTYVALADSPEIIVVDMANGETTSIAATNNGAGAFAVGATNNVCH